ncbi:MAG: hypothetical protein ABMB14_19380, partial [Myxococcota bacterium]
LGPTTEPSAWAFYPHDYGNVLDAFTVDGFVPGAEYLFDGGIWGSDQPWLGTFVFPPAFVLASPGAEIAVDPAVGVELGWDDPLPGAAIDVKVTQSSTDAHAWCTFADTGHATLDPSMFAEIDPGGTTVLIQVWRRSTLVVPLDGVGSLIASVSIEAPSIQSSTR